MLPDQILEWGIEVILVLQGLGDWLIGPMNLLTSFGNIEFYLLVMPLIYWCWDSQLGLRIGIIFLLNNGLNALLKTVTPNPRPYWLDPRVRLLTNPEGSLGIPSGHAQNAVVVWGLLAAYLRTGWAWAAALFLMIFIGLSRMYLGVHYPTDVFAGWLLGLIVLILFFKLEGPVAARLAQLNLPAQLAVVLAVSVGLVLIGGLIAFKTDAGWDPPLEWIENSAAQAPDAPIAPFSLELLVSSAGTFLGFTAGAILLKPEVGFKAGGPWLRRLGRYIIGAIGVLLLWQGLGSLFELLAEADSLAGYTLRYIRYCAIGVWVSLLGPLLFIRLGLAEGQQLPAVEIRD
jgi:membrane-associated phospholipid phosphatase